MFGFGNRTARRSYGKGGNHMLRNAALAGLGMMAFRWLRNRRASKATEPKDAW
jgi:hypothetical protein